jgi:hypothetical protein
MAGLAQAATGLDPAEPFLDPLADALADGIASMASGVSVNGRTAVGGVLRHMRRDLELAQIRDKTGHVIGLVGGKRDAMTGVAALEHAQGRFPLGGSGRKGEFGVDNQAMAVLRASLNSPVLAGSEAPLMISVIGAIYLTIITARTEAMATTKAIEFAGIGTVAGTLKQVRDRLERSHAERVVALTMEHENEVAEQAFMAMVTNFWPLVQNMIIDRQNQKINSIIEALMPDIPLPKHKLIEARMAAEARKAVLESGDWLTASQIADMAGFSATNPSAQPNKWKKDGRIFAINHHGADYFPGYALDPSAQYRPAKGLPKVLDVFRGHKNDWGLAYWFASVNSFLGGKRPQELLLNEPECVVAAAEDEVAGILHG